MWGIILGTNENKLAEKLLVESLKELDSSNGSVISGVQKLSRASDILEDRNTHLWCEIQLGNSKYTKPLKKYSSLTLISLKEYQELGKFSKKTEEDIANFYEKFDELGISKKLYDNYDEMEIKLDKFGGGFAGIGFIEERYNDLVRTKTAHDALYYKGNLSKHINYVKREAHNKSTQLYKKVVFSDAPHTVFDVLKSEIDDKLLDLDPELAEKLMIAFRGVMTNKPEEWSQSLTTCRRLIKNLADDLYPPINGKIDGRSLDETHYMNRLWMFMDNSIESESDKELAKKHVLFIGNYLESLHNKTQKGVHSTLTRYESIKVVIHIYMIIGDILDYLNKPVQKEKKLNIHSASLDELESILGLKRSIAKEIIKLRVEHKELDIKKLRSIKGIGPKTILKIEDMLSLDPA